MGSGCDGCQRALSKRFGFLLKEKMGRKSEIAFGHVCAVAEMLRASGRNPTVRAVRKLLGNKGSMGTLNGFLSQWKRNQILRYSIASIDTDPLIFVWAMEIKNYDVKSNEHRGACGESNNKREPVFVTKAKSILAN